MFTADNRVQGDTDKKMTNTGSQTIRRVLNKPSKNNLKIKQRLMVKILPKLPVVKFRHSLRIDFLG